MNKIIFLIFITILAIASSAIRSAFSCTISLNEPTIYANQDPVELEKQLVKATSCLKDTIQSFISQSLSISMGSNGKINSHYLIETNKDKFTEQINEVTPKTFSLLSLKNFITQQLKLPNNLSVENAEIVGIKKHFNISNGSSITINCNNCDNSGTKNFSIAFKNNDSLLETVWVKCTISALADVIIANTTISPGINTLDESMFSKKQIYLSTTNDLFSDFEKIKFYRTNRNFRSGEIVKRNDLIPIILVRQGTPIQTIFQSNGLTITGNAYATNSGKIGDIIEFKNIKTNKRLIGKVVDFNKVQVNL